MKRISVSQLKLLLDSDPDRVRFVDVRSPGDWETGRIPGALNIPYWYFTNNLPGGLIEGQFNYSPTVFYCGAELLSTMCVEAFPKGCDFAVLEGGFGSWLNSQMPVERDEELSDELFERYRPQVRAIGEKAQERLLQARVGVIGLGGLGCPAVQYLAGAGIREIVLVDHDRVSESNLHRQVLYGSRNIRDRLVGDSKAVAAADAVIRLNHHVRVIATNSRLTQENAAEIITGCAVVLDCTDNFETRFVLHAVAKELGIPVVYGASQGMQGEVAVFGPDGPCYRCMTPEAPEIAGCVESGAFGPMCGVIGSMQAAEALKIAAKIDTMYGLLTRFDMLSGQSFKIHINKRQGCCA